MNKNTVLVIDDEPDICELLSLTLTRMGLDCHTISTLKEAIDCIEKNDYALVLSDMRLPDGDGIDIVKFIQQNKPKIPVAVITAFGNIEGAVNTLKAGAFDYLSKPVDLKLLKDLVKTALATNQKLVSPSADVLLGDSLIMQEVRQTINKLARNQAPVFIFGESGVGKELVAQLIHRQGPRSDQPFIPVNCGAIPADLMESEFFGHKKGSFTGAFADKSGLFLAANGGTLLLDEIAELTLAMQVKLLRAIQEKAIKPIGELNEISVDVRILSTSHKNLQEEIKAGNFREDLYYRVNVIELRIPSLRNRATDIPILATHIYEQLAHKQNRNMSPLSQSCLDALQSYDFPGNVRELENILERAMALSENNKIEVRDLSLTHKKAVLPIEKIKKPDLNSSLSEHEKELILHALKTTKWNRTAAAKMLGVSFRTLRYRLKKLGID